MWNFFHRANQRVRALTLKQIFIESLFTAPGVSIVSFYYSRSVWHTLLTGAIFLLINMLWWCRLQRD